MKNRRQMMGWAAAGAAGMLWAEQGHAEPRPLLGRGDRLDLAERAKQIIEDAHRLGYDYEKRYGGCSQCTVAALQDAVPFVPAEAGLFRGASCLDGGATPKGIQNCGSFTGAGMVIGHLCGRTRDEIFFGDKKLSHELMRKLYQRFEGEYGSVLCRDVKEGAKRDCNEVVGRAAQWTAEILLEAFSDYRPPAAPAQEPPKPDAADRPQ